MRSNFCVKLAEVFSCLFISENICHSRWIIKANVDASSFCFSTDSPVRDEAAKRLHLPGIYPEGLELRTKLWRNWPVAALNHRSEYFVGMCKITNLLDIPLWTVNEIRRVRLG